MPDNKFNEKFKRNIKNLLNHKESCKNWKTLGYESEKNCIYGKKKKEKGTSLEYQLIKSYEKELKKEKHKERYGKSLQKRYST